MPDVIATPRSLRNGEVITEFTDTTSTTAVTYTYPIQQAGISIENSGVADIFVTVGSYTNQVINPNKTWKADVVYTSFSIRSNVNSQEFTATAFQNDIEGSGEADSVARGMISNINAQLAGKADIAYVDSVTSALAIGSPKGTYATLADLQAAIPAGNTNIYVVAADGNWYYWNGSTWTAGGQYQSALSTFANILDNSNIATTVNPTGANQQINIFPGGTNSIFSSYSATYQKFQAVTGHKYYARYVHDVASTGKLSGTVRMIYSDNTFIDSVGSVVNGVVSAIITATKDLLANIAITTAQAGSIIRTNQLFVDLTDLYGAGNEPSLVDFEELLAYFPNSWFGKSNQLNEVQRVLINAFSQSRNALIQQSNDLVKQKFLPDSTFKMIGVATTDKMLMWYDTAKRILYATSNVTPDTSRTSLYASDDFGLTWATVYTSPYGINKFKTLKSGYHLMFTTNSRVRRISPDFKTTQEWFGANVYQPLSSGLGITDNGNGTILFGEYSANVGAVCNIYKSTDDGVNWTVSKDGTGVRHWHSVQVDPYTGYLWACSGDADPENAMWLSTDNGTTWTPVIKTNSQVSRAVGLAFTSNSIYWGMDSASASPRIYKANKTTYAITDLGATPYNNPTLGIAKAPDGSIVGWTRVEANSSQKEIAALYSIKNDVVSVLQTFGVVADASTQPGITVASGIDAENKMFVQAGGTITNGLIGYVLPLSQS